MRLLLISPDFPPPFVGGSLVYIYNLLDAFSEPIDILTGPLPKGAVDSISKRHRVFRSRFIATFFYRRTKFQKLITYPYCLLWLIQRCLLVRYDAVIVNFDLVGNSLLILLSKVLGIPIIGVAYAEELTIPRRSQGPENLIKRFLMRWAYKHASGFVSVCRFAKEILTSLGVPPDRVEVIPPTLSLVKRSKTRLAAVPDHRILSVGRLIARKGFNYLIDAIRLLRTDIPDIHLTIVGNGQERESLLRKILDAHLEHQVSMRTNVPDEELAELYQECDVFVLANVMLDNGDCEGSPTVLIEASSCGKPVIGGASGGTDTMIEDGKTGYLVDPRDTRVLARRLKEILSDSSLAFQMGMAGIQKVETQHRPHDASIRFHAFIQRIVANA